MKADDPQRPAEKYGMPIAQAEPFAACQVAIAEERNLYRDLRFAHAVAALHRLRSAFDQRGIRQPQVALRALGRRVAKLEVARQPRPTPFGIWFGSVDDWIDKHVIPSIARGDVCATEMLDVVAAVRSWHTDGHYASWAHERVWER